MMDGGSKITFSISKDFATRFNLHLFIFTHKDTQHKFKTKSEWIPPSWCDFYENTKLVIVAFPNEKTLIFQS